MKFDLEKEKNKAKNIIVDVINIIEKEKGKSIEEFETETNFRYDVSFNYSNFSVTVSESDCILISIEDTQYFLWIEVKDWEPISVRFHWQDFMAFKWDFNNNEEFIDKEVEKADYILFDAWKKLTIKETIKEKMENF